MTEIASTFCINCLKVSEEEELALRYEPSWLCRFLQLVVVVIGGFLLVTVPSSEAKRAQLSGGPAQHPLLYMTGTLQGFAMMSFVPMLSSLGVALRDEPGGRLHGLRRLDGLTCPRTDQTPNNGGSGGISIAAGSRLKRLMCLLTVLSCALIAVGAKFVANGLFFLPPDTELQTRAIHSLTGLFVAVVLPLHLAGWLLSFFIASWMVRDRIIEIIRALRSTLPASAAWFEFVSGPSMRLMEAMNLLALGWAPGLLATFTFCWCWGLSHLTLAVNSPVMRGQDEYKDQSGWMMQVCHFHHLSRVRRSSAQFARTAHDIHRQIRSCSLWSCAL